MSGRPGVDDLVRDYRTALLRHVSRRDEQTLALGYDLGRRALSRDTGLLGVAMAHHEVLGEIAADPTYDLGEVIPAAAELLAEVLASYEMSRRVAGGRGGRQPRG